MKKELKLFIIGNKDLKSSSSSVFLDDMSSHFGNIMQKDIRKSNMVLCGSSLKNDSYKMVSGRYLIQRLDGVYFDLDDKDKMRINNSKIKKTYYRANGVIFQSLYAKKMVESIIGSPLKKWAIIHNGCNNSESYKNKFIIKFKHIHDMKKDGYKIFLAAASWRSIKRVDNIVDGFLEYNRINPKSKLILAGDKCNYEKANHNSIISMGKIRKKDLMSLYCGADLFINLSFSDACPNSVIEALSSKVPILITSNQGVAEIYNGNGYVIKEKWDFSPIHYSKIPKLNNDTIVDGINKALDAGYKNDIDLSMRTCSYKYLDFMRSIL